AIGGSAAAFRRSRARREADRAGARRCRRASAPGAGCIPGASRALAGRQAGVHQGMSAGTRIGASGSLSRARELVRQGALDAADAMVNDALSPNACMRMIRSRTAGFFVLR